MSQSCFSHYFPLNVLIPHQNYFLICHANLPRAMGCFLSALTMNTEKTENVTGQISIRKVAINYRKKQTSKQKNPTLPQAQDISDVQICIVWKSIWAVLLHVYTMTFHFLLTSPNPSLTSIRTDPRKTGLFCQLSSVTDLGFFLCFKF